MALIALIPTVGEFFGILLSILPGTKGTNKFGNQPGPASHFHVLMIVLLPMVTISILCLMYASSSN